MNLFIPSTTWNNVIKLFVWIIWSNSSWLNRKRCINNTLFLWYITDNIRSFPKFNCLYITPKTLCCTNSKNLWYDSTWNKTKNLGARKWIFLMPQMTITISYVFYFPYKLISIKWTNLVIKFSVLSPKYVLSNSHLVFSYSMK